MPTAQLANFSASFSVMFFTSSGFTAEGPKEEPRVLEPAETRRGSAIHGLSRGGCHRTTRQRGICSRGLWPLVNANAFLPSLLSPPLLSAEAPPVQLTSVRVHQSTRLLSKSWKEYAGVIFVMILAIALEGTLQDLARYRRRRRQYSSRALAYTRLLSKPWTICMALSACYLFGSPLACIPFFDSPRTAM